MKNTFRKNAHLAGSKPWQLAVVCALLLVVAGCGKDSDDGDVVNTIALPLDDELRLYCPDVGLAAESCVLDDPENPYANSPFDDDLAFELSDAAPSEKAKFYLWATAQARQPQGKYQFFVANALHNIFASSGSDIVKEQAQRAYRALLDNYFASVWFLKVPSPGGDILFPVNLSNATGIILVDPADPDVLIAGLVPLYGSDALARQAMGEWGYTYDTLTKQTIKNN